MKRLLAAALAIAISLPAFAREKSVPTEFQKLHPCPSTGKTTGACPGWTRDHVIPLACGGPDTISNLQWQTTAEAREKDKWERKICK